MAADIASLRDREFRRILLIKLSAVGDVVHTFPVANGLRRRYPAARIDWVVKPAIAELVCHHPAIDNVVLYADHAASHPWRSGWAAVAAARRLVSELRSAGYELVIDLQGQLRTALLTLATGAPLRIGFDRPRNEVWRASERRLPSLARRHAWQGAREGSWLAYTHRLSIPTLDMHAVDRYLRFGSMLGIEEDAVDFSFAIPDSSVVRVDRLLGEALGGLDVRRLAVIAPGTVWETKHWSSEGFAAVARHLMRRNLAVVLVGSNGERATCQQAPRRDLHHQRLRADAPRGGTRPARCQHFWTDRPAMDRPLPAARSRAECVALLLALLSAPAQPVSQPACLHARHFSRLRHRQDRDRAGQRE